MGEDRTERDVPQGARRESGKARVKRVLFGALEAKGVRRRRGVTVDEHAATLNRIADELDHLDESKLETLALAMLPYAGGAGGDLWPAEVIFLRLGWALRPRRLSDCRMTVSWMRSAAGRAAWDEGPMVAAELLAFFDRPPGGRRRVPAPYDMQNIREKAADREAVVRRARARLESGSGGESEAETIRAAERLVEAARRFVFSDVSRGKETADAA